jgi:hypothetical protein
MRNDDDELQLLLLIGLRQSTLHTTGSCVRFDWPWFIPAITLGSHWEWFSPNRPQHTPHKPYIIPLPIIGIVAIKYNEEYSSLE